MKEIIEKCIEYIKSVSLKEPIEFRVEELAKNRVVLSFKEKEQYSYSWDVRIYKELEINDFRDVVSMKNFYVK